MFQFHETYANKLQQTIKVDKHQQEPYYKGSTVESGIIARPLTLCIAPVNEHYTTT